MNIIANRKAYYKQLNKCFDTSFELNEDDKIMFFDDILNNIQFKSDNEKYPDWLFFFYDNTFMMGLNNKNQYLYCSYHYIWRVFVNEFKMGYTDIQSFIKNKVEKHFKLRGLTPLENNITYIPKVEEHFKLRDLTPLTRTFVSTF